MLASGQLEEGHLADPREALALGLGPARLEDAWSVRYRYGVAGTLVRYLDETAGREALVALLAATTEEELFALAGLGEQELLDRWAADLLDRAR